jgi:alpha-amylase
MPYFKKLLCGLIAMGLLAGCGTSGMHNEPQVQIPEPVQEQKASNEEKPVEKPPGVRGRPREIENKYGVYYEIFVRSFADSDGDGIGDFKGLTANLDYVNDGDPDTTTDLGANGIWLMPINTSPSYHQYDVTDYYDIDPDYGTKEDFKEFLDEAHKRGIKVIMDLVVNHTSTQHPWFIEAVKDPNSKYRDYYRWAKEGEEGINLGAVVWGHKVWNKKGSDYYFALFWDQMPDLNMENQVVRDEIKDIAQFWLKEGVDGFRLDAAKHVFDVNEYPKGTNVVDKNVEWWMEFRIACEEANPDVYLVGEVWDSARSIAPYFKGLDSAFNFEVAEKGVSTLLKFEKDLGGTANKFAKNLEQMHSTFAKEEPNFLDAPFLSNHDQNRIMNEIGQDVNKAKLGANILLTLPGNPFIYYGEEIGMLGTKPDERIREPLKWFTKPKAPQTKWQPIDANKDTVAIEVQDKDSKSLLTHYRNMIRVRQSNEALMKGNMKALESNSNRIVAYSRNRMDGETVKESVVVLHNLFKEEQIVSVKDVDFSKLKVIFESTEGVKVEGTEITIPPYTTVILQ